MINLNRNYFPSNIHNAHIHRLSPGPTQLPKSPSKFWQIASKIHSFVTLDRIAKASLAACAIVGGAMILSNPKMQTVLDGIRVASVGATAVCSVWGGASIIQGRKEEGARRLAAGVGFYALALLANGASLHPHSVSKNPKTDENNLTIEQKIQLRLKTIQNAQKQREITFGATYVKGNPTRDRLSQLVDKNHKEYAEAWDLKHRVVDDNLLINACSSPHSWLGSQTDCVPYWNKVAVLRNWLKTPKTEKNKEEWYVLADDDMPVTNMKVNPYKAIDQLRRGKDTSIIIARDVQLWKNNDPNLSVNTGLLFVRKDEKSQKFIESLWEKRNNPTHSRNKNCQTLGTCKNQDVLHEQEAFARVLIDNRNLLNRVVTVVEPRNMYDDEELALNTFNRNGCFIREQEHWGKNRIVYNDGYYPEGQWRAGDWMGQTAGIPVHGWYCDDYENGKPPGPVREDRLKEMIAQAVKADFDLTSIKKTSKTDSFPLGKKKEIRLATVTDNFDKEGNLNKDRQQITDLALENHKKYANRWKLKHDVVSKSLVANECSRPQGKITENCSPYWNKIKYFVNWCKQPTESFNNDKEEWAIYSDDDGIYTNLNIDPSEAIDRLRSGHDTSFIVSTEGPTTPYPESEGGNARGSIKGPANTGVLIVRKDQKGCDVIKRIWEHRNTPTPHLKPKSEKTNCATYGLCNDQSNGDEQGAVDKVLWEDIPQLVGEHVTRIQPRDPPSPSRAKIAFNTVHRGGCVQALNNGKLLYPWDISNGDLAGNKEGIWQKGDWIGQTAGFPMYGVYYPEQKIICEADPKRKSQPIRVEKVKEMLNEVES